MSSIKPLKTLQYDLLPVYIYGSSEETGYAASLDAREIIIRALDDREEANIILATGNSQLSFLRALRDLDGINWAYVQSLSHG